MCQQTDRLEISLEGVRNQKQLYRALKEAGLMDAEDGANADALYDVLTAVATPTEIFLIDCDDPEAYMGEYMDRLHEVCEDAEAKNENISVYFW